MPPPALRRHLIFVIERDTRGCELNPLQAFTYGSASPNMTLIWMWHGQMERLQHWCPDNHQAPRDIFQGPILISGSTTQPWIQYAAESRHALIAAFRPSAMRELFGIEPSDWMDRIEPLQDSGIDVSWIEWAQQILEARNSDKALPLLYGGLIQRLNTLHNQPHATAETAPMRTSHWLRWLQQQTSTSSLRSLQRLIKQATGTTVRQLGRFIRLEELGVMITKGHVHPGSERNQADLAAAAGFSDQAHMAREVKQTAGFSPGEAFCRFFQYESFWLYRAVMGLHR